MVVWEALNALSHQLELCKIDADTRVVLLLEPGAPTEHVHLLRAALSRTGAEAIEVRPVRSAAAGQGSLLSHALAQAHVVLATDPDHERHVRDLDARVLHVDLACPPSEFPPHANLRRRTRRLAETLAGPTTVHLSDPHGTSLTIASTTPMVDLDYGLIDDRSPTAHFPAGWVRLTPSAGSVAGELVVMPGDAHVSAGRLVSSPVRCTIVDDHIARIEGDNADADVLRAVLEYAGETSAYGFAGLTIGMNPGTTAVHAFSPALIDATRAQLAAGVVTLGFGDNLVADRPCRQTTVLSLVARDLHVDRLPILQAGELQGDFAPDVYET